MQQRICARRFLGLPATPSGASLLLATDQRGGIIMSGRLVLSAAVAAVLACSVSINSAAAQSRSLYERLCGYDAILAGGGPTHQKTPPRPRGEPVFSRAHLPPPRGTAARPAAGRRRRMLADQICVAAGGLCVYVGRDMKSAHAGMGIRSSHFNALVEDLGKALKKFKVPARERRELVALLAPTKKDIVER